MLYINLLRSGVSLLSVAKDKLKAPQRSAKNLLSYIIVYIQYPSPGNKLTVLTLCSFIPSVYANIN